MTQRDFSSVTYNNEVYTARKHLAGIYRITSLHNGQFYIGSSDNIVRRLQNHIQRLRKDKHLNPKLQSYYNKYGEYDLEFDVIEVSTGTR